MGEENPFKPALSEKEKQAIADEEAAEGMRATTGTEVSTLEDVDELPGSNDGDVVEEYIKAA